MSDTLYIDGKKYLGVGDAARAFNVSAKEVADAIAHGSVRHKLVGTRAYVEQQSFAHYLSPPESEPPETPVVAPEPLPKAAQPQKMSPKPAAVRAPREPAVAATVPRPAPAVVPRTRMPRLSMTSAQPVLAAVLGLLMVATLASGGYFAFAPGKETLRGASVAAATAADSSLVERVRAYLNELFGVGAVAQAPGLDWPEITEKEATGALPPASSTPSLAVSFETRPVPSPVYSAAPASAPAAVQPAPVVIERIIERVASSAPGVDQTVLDARLQELYARLSGEITTRSYVPAAQVWDGVGQALRFEQLDDIAINTATITGGTISGVSSISTASLGVTGTGTSTFAGGVSLTGGCVSVNGTCLGTGYGTVGSGTTGQIPYYAANGTTLSATSSIFIATSGNIGIGTTTPSQVFAVSGTSGGELARFDAGSSGNSHISVTAGTGRVVLAALNNAGGAVGSFDDSNFSLRTNNTDRVTIDTSGNVGIGTTSPFRRLSLTDAVSTAQVAIAYDTSRYTDLLTNSVGDLVIDPQGSDVFLNDDNLWVCTGGSCPSGSPAGTGNLVVENQFLVGTTSVMGTRPATIGSSIDANLALAANSTGAYWAFDTIASDGRLRIAGSTPGGVVNITQGGSVGVGTTTPTQQLSVQNLLYVGAGGASGMGTATSTFQGDIKILGKLDVSTIDPVYTIDGVKYATYGHSTVGIKEEVALKVTPQAYDEKKEMYVYVLNFKKVPMASDAWLFYRITDFGTYWEKLVVTLTPSFDGRAFYEEDVAARELRIYADEPLPVSVRMIADRFDATEWGNIRPDQDDPWQGLTPPPR